MKKLLFVCFLLLPASSFADVVGCDKGILVDPEAWFLKRIDRVKGQPAMDWHNVLTEAGIGRGPAPWVQPGPENYGITQQISDFRGVVGRIFLPTNQPDGLGYYTKYVDVLEGPQDNLRWAWKPEGANTYAPRACNGGAPPIGGDTPPSTDTSKIDAIAAELAQLGERVLFLGDQLANLNTAWINLDTKVSAIDGVVKFLEARPVVVGCQVQFLRCAVTKDR